MRFDPIPFDFSSAATYWGIVMGVVFAFLAVIWLLVAILSRGPVDGISHVFKSGLAGVFDFFTASPKRILALAKLTIKEAVRRKALLVFVVFAILFMFGAWFLPSSTDRTDLQVKVYISFVLTAISWLVLPVMLLLACWGLPEDIRLRSLHTVVTKPAKRFEILLGRIIGYSTVGLFVVGIMSVVGYIWLWRQVSPETPIQRVVKGDVAGLNCRVPVWGNLIFHNRDGQPTEEGINVGNEWKFRSYIEGATKARAVWTFKSIDESQISNDKLRVEALFESFRTTKGKMGSGLICQYTLVNNLREKAFGSFSIPKPFFMASTFLREGQFANAAVELQKTADNVLSEPDLTNMSDLGMMSNVSGYAAKVLKKSGTDAPWFTDFVAALENVSTTAQSLFVARQSGADGDVTELSEAIADLSNKMKDNSSGLQEAIPSIEVALPPFEVAEYRAGENVMEIDRSLEWEGGDEDVARFLAGIFSDVNQTGFVEGGQLSDTAMESLVTDGLISDGNSDRLKQVFSELLADGSIKAADGKLELPEGQSFFALFSDLARDSKITASQGWKLKSDLFEDVVTDGDLTVKVACHSVNQYLGMARPDLFIRLPDRPFGMSYYKAIGAIALMMIMVVVLGVTASTFVKGPVAILLTGAFIVFGKPLYGFMTELVTGKVQGGGVLSSAYRLYYHMNPTNEIEASQWVLNIIEYGDKAIGFLPRVAQGIIPNFNFFTAPAVFVENGFDVDWNAGLQPCIATTVAVLIPCLLIGNFSLKHRELESK